MVPKELLRSHGGPGADIAIGVELRIRGPRSNLMSWFVWDFRIPILARQATSVLLLATMVAMHLPIRVDSSSAGNGKDHSVPFPCRGRACGCRTAEQCRRKCCCFSREQKIAWASRHGVPEKAVVAAEGELVAETSSGDRSKQKSRGTTVLQKGKIFEWMFAAVLQHKTERRACCSSRVQASAGASSNGGAIDESLRRQRTRRIQRYVIGVMAQECQGSAHALADYAVFLVPPRPSLAIIAEPTGERFVFQGAWFEEPITEPATPPPRLVDA